MYSFFIGTDVSKATIDVSYYVGSKAIYLGQFSNKVYGFKKMVAQLELVTQIPKTSWFICFENTGVYSKSFLEWLFSQGIPCREENALKISKSLGIKRGKSDKADSRDICQYAYEKRGIMIPTKLSKPLIIILRRLLSRRNLLVRSKQSFSNSLMDQKSVVNPEIFHVMSEHNKAMTDMLTQQIEEIDLLIKSTIKQDDQTATNDELLRSIKGIGPVIAAYLIAFTDDFTTFDNSRQFACYCGIAPFPNQSGTKTGRTKVNHMANKRIKAVLSNGINSAIQWDTGIKNYYNRKIGEGKAKGVVLNAVKNKIIHRAFAVINRQTPYIKLAY